MDPIDWLLENGGPIIRYRTTTELLEPAEKIGHGV